MRYNFIIGLAFGKGNVNRELGRIIGEIAKIDEDAKIIVQDDIFDASEDILPITDLIIKSGGYKDTFKVLEEARDFINLQYEDSRIILVCHELHQKRARAIARKLGLRVIRIEIGEIPLDRNDEQKHCRNELIYRIWDLAAWIRYLLE